MTQGELEKIPLAFERLMSNLEIQIMGEIVRAIKVNGFSTSSADYQMQRLIQMGKSESEIKKYVKESMSATDEELDRIFSDTVYEYYYGYGRAYESSGSVQISFDDNAELQALVTAVKRQTRESFRNMTDSMGFAIRNPATGKITYSPLMEFYQNTLDSSVMEMVSGTFSYDKALNRAINTMTNSGLRWIDYDSGWHNRVNVAARRAVMTGFRQIQGKINEQVAKDLDTDSYEVSYHIGARPEHQPWQGRVWTYEELVSVCGLGTVTGLHGANCYHDYNPFIPGISVRTYTDEQLDEMLEEENKPKSYNGKEYTSYEALQEQRRMETAMRKTRQDIALLQDGGADKESITLKKARYQVQMQQYKSFSGAMGLPEQMQRVYQDGINGIKENSNKIVAKAIGNGTIKERNISNRNMPNGLRASPFHILTKAEIESLKADARKLGIPLDVLRFNEGNRTGFSDKYNIIYVKGDVLPDESSGELRDLLSQKAVLAHEYYGHYKSHPSNFWPGDWRDEFRASYRAALDTPNLTDEEKRMLMLDAYDRAKEAGIPAKYNKEARRIIYGYDD